MTEQEFNELWLATGLWQSNMALDVMKPHTYVCPKATLTDVQYFLEVVKILRKQASFNEQRYFDHFALGIVTDLPTYEYFGLLVGSDSEARLYIDKEVLGIQEGETLFNFLVREYK